MRGLRYRISSRDPRLRRRRALERRYLPKQSSSRNLGFDSADPEEVSFRTSLSRPAKSIAVPNGSQSSETDSAQQGNLGARDHGPSETSSSRISLPHRKATKTSSRRTQNQERTDTLRLGRTGDSRRRALEYGKLGGA